VPPWCAHAPSPNWRGTAEKWGYSKKISGTPPLSICLRRISMNSYLCGRYGRAVVINICNLPCKRSRPAGSERDERRTCMHVSVVDECKIHVIAVYTSVNSDILSYILKTEKNQKGDITQQHITKFPCTCCWVMSPFWFLLFSMCNSLYRR